MQLKGRSNLLQGFIACFQKRSRVRIEMFDLQPVGQ
jgi:hypothetical protein